MRSEEARIGTKVMVGEAGLLNDGRTQLFWHHELDEIDARGA
jgi:hypothetical protein